MNPYRPDTLLAGMLGHAERFIGLREELEWLLTQLTEERPAAVSLVGPWGFGKSVVLKLLANPDGARRSCPGAIGMRFREDPESLLFVLIAFEDSTLPDRANGHMLTLLYDRLLLALAGLLQIPDARLLPLDRLPVRPLASVKDLRAMIQHLLARAGDEQEESELRERFEATLGPRQPGKLIELLKRLNGCGLRTIFLLDDFDSIIDQLDRADFDHLRALLTASSLVTATKVALSELVPDEVGSSPFFNLLQRLNLVSLHFLPEDEARRFIIEPPKWLEEPVPFHFSEPDVDFILELTGLHPDLIRTSCEHLYRWTRGRRADPGEDLLPPEEQPYIRVRLRVHFADHFAVLWRLLGKDEHLKLIVIARGEPGDSGRMGVAPGSALAKLISRGYVVCEHGHYRIFAGLFRDYVLDQAGATPADQPPPKAALTELETKLLELLQGRPGETIDRDELIAALYDVRPDEHDQRTLRNRLDALIFRLRGKLESEPILIENIRGQGYRLVQTRGEP